MHILSILIEILIYLMINANKLVIRFAFTSCFYKLLSQVDIFR